MNCNLFFKTELFLIYLTSKSDKGPFISRDVRVYLSSSSFITICLCTTDKFLHYLLGVRIP